VHAVHSTRLNIIGSFGTTKSFSTVKLCMKMSNSAQVRLEKVVLRAPQSAVISTYRSSTNSMIIHLLLLCNIFHGAKWPRRSPQKEKELDRWSTYLLNGKSTRSREPLLLFQPLLQTSQFLHFSLSEEL
jgi:hypothetical protein